MARWDKAAPSAIPEWFFEAVETPADSGTVEVDDCDVAWRRWSSPEAVSGEPPLLLLHGMYAHSHWWDFIAPSLARHRPVGAMDLTGMGDSDYRYQYSGPTYVAEVLAAAEAMGFGDTTIVVGHSFGGLIGLLAAAAHPERFGGLIMVDSGLRHPDEPEPDRPPMAGGARAYPDKATAVARFRLQPPQNCENAYILEYIARNSVLPVDGGWVWKFDDDLLDSLTEVERTPDLLRNLRVPTGLIFGARSALYSARCAQYTQSLLPPGSPCELVEDAQHHVFLDQPLAFIETLERVLAALPPAARA